MLPRSKTEDAVQSVAFSPDGKQIVTGGYLFREGVGRRERKRRRQVN